jgi:anti-anti-sigma factor
MLCAFSRIPPAFVIQLTGRWDAFSAPDFERFWERFTREQDPRLVVLDLTNVDYVSSFGLRGVLDVGKQLAGLGGAMHVAGLCPPVDRVFQGSGLGSLFPSFADAVAAAAALTQKARTP